MQCGGCALSFSRALLIDMNNETGEDSSVDQMNFEKRDGGLSRKIFEILGGLMILFFMGVVIWQSINTDESEQFVPFPDKVEVNEEVDVKEFRSKLEEQVRIEIGQPIEGYEPSMFMQVFPGLLPVDFDRVEAQIGSYVYEKEELRHELGDVDVIHSAAQAITEDGMEILLDNIISRLSIDREVTKVDEIIKELKSEQQIDEPEINHIACTADAKICPDGTGVGRVGPNCEFAECPTVEEEPAVKQITCSPESKLAEICTMEYAPVCGLVDVQCVTTPCNPVPQTFGNACGACAQGNVTSYSEGSCEDSYPQVI